MCKTVSFSPSFCFHIFLAFHGFFFHFLKIKVVKVEPLLAQSIDVIICKRSL